MKSHRCKYHRYSHAYDRCANCGHEYCGRGWQSCPRCTTGFLPTPRERNDVSAYVSEGLGENIDFCPSDNS